MQPVSRLGREGNASRQRPDDRHVHWGDGTVNAIKRTIMHNTVIAPRMDGNLAPADIDTVAAYVWALGRRDR